MPKPSANRDAFVKALSILCIALVFALGAVQAAHAHQDDSSAHHACSICAAAHAQVRVQTAVLAPVLATAPAASSIEHQLIVFRPPSTHFSRPPPAL